VATAQAHITMTADGKPIAALQELIAKRIALTNESAKEALAACAIQILTSLRAVTAVAKADNPEVEAEAGLYPSIWDKGGAKIPCLRVTGSKTRYPASMIWAAGKGVKLSALQVFSFEDTHGEKSRKRYIVATDAKAAQKAARDFIKRRIARHKGLAKLALGKLMAKAARTSKPVTDAANQDTTRIAGEVTRATSSGTGTGSSGHYTLTCEDNLDYALLALKGGQAAFDEACGKAANKIASVIKNKLADSFLKPDIQTPFPELRGRK